MRMFDLIIAVLIIAVAAVIVGGLFLRAAAIAKDQARHADMMCYLQAKDRAQAEADTQSRAVQLYAMQAALDVIRTQAECQSRVQEQTIYALRQTIDAMHTDHKTVDALAAMQWRALESHYAAALPDKKGQSGRYWEEVDFNV